jgi:DNA topoisomerase-2
MSQTLKRIAARHFIHSEVKGYSHANVVRSIPTLFDGMKPSHRKVIYGMLKRGENAKEIQVERVAAGIASITDYHHGVGSLEGTIVGLARTYAGTNNMNLLMPNGQFGSRLTSEAAAGRYIMTEFSPYFRQLFKKEDDILLENIMVDGEPIEPKTYYPLMPISLINGAEGTATGHATYILQYHPEHVRDACIKVLDGKKLPMDTLIPWFRDFQGHVTKDEDTGQITYKGTLEVVGANKIIVTELPIGMYLDDYKEILFGLKDAGLIKDFDDESGADSVSGEVRFKFICSVPRSTAELDLDVLYTKFKLIKRETENYTLWNEEGVLERFSSPEEIVQRFVKWRLGFYEERRQRLIRDETENNRFLNEKLRFILFYLKNSKEFHNRPKQELIDILLKNNFVDYDDLLKQQIWKLTHDEIEKLKKEIADTAARLKALMEDTAKEMYKRELKAFKYDPDLGKPKDRG